MRRTRRPEEDEVRLLPLPVAGFYHRAQLAREPKARHDLALWAWEASVRLGAAFHGAPRGDRLARPSLGAWVEVVQAAPALRLDHPVLTALHRVCTTLDTSAPDPAGVVSRAELLGALVAYRNTLAHGGPPSGGRYDPAAAGDLLLEGLRIAWDAGVFLPVAARVVTPEPDGVTASGTLLTRWIQLCGFRATPLPEPPTVDEVRGAGPRRGAPRGRFGIPYAHVEQTLASLAPWILLQRTDSDYRFWFFDGRSRTQDLYKDLHENRRIGAADLAALDVPGVDAAGVHATRTHARPRRRPVRRTHLRTVALLVLLPLSAFAAWRVLEGAPPEPSGRGERDADGDRRARLGRLLSRVDAESDPRERLRMLTESKSEFAVESTYRAAYERDAVLTTESEAREFLARFSFALDTPDSVLTMRRRLQSVRARLDLCRAPVVVFYIAFLTYLTETEDAALEVVRAHGGDTPSPHLAELEALLLLEKEKKPTPLPPFPTTHDAAYLLLRAHHLLRRAVCLGRDEDRRAILALVATPLYANPDHAFALTVRALVHRMEGRLAECLADLERVEAVCEETGRPGVWAWQTRLHAQLARRRPVGSPERRAHDAAADRLTAKALASHAEIFPWLVQMLAEDAANDHDRAHVCAVTGMGSAALCTLREAFLGRPWGGQVPRSTRESYAIAELAPWIERTVAENASALRGSTLDGFPLALVAEVVWRTSQREDWLRTKQISGTFLQGPERFPAQGPDRANLSYLLGAHIVSAINFARDETPAARHAHPDELLRILALAEAYDAQGDGSWHHAWNAHAGIGWACALLALAKPDDPQAPEWRRRGKERLHAQRGLILEHASTQDAAEEVADIDAMLERL